VVDLPDFNKLWNFSQPAETEQRFLELLPAAEQFGDRSYHAQLLTQIARAQGLQNRFDDAHATLDCVEKLLTDNPILPRIRYCLERGRVFNTSGQRLAALPFFQQAHDIALGDNQMRYAIDAIHMLAIADPDPAKQIEWNLKGIAMAQANPDQRGWLWSLYNNIAESYAAAHGYQSALTYILKLIDYQKETGDPDIHTLKDQARFLRLLNRPSESLAIIQPIHEKLAGDNKEDGWIEEELAETLFALNRSADAHPHFLKAYALLTADPWVQRHDSAKLTRLAQRIEESK
jgi:tetratricopeptide (TPR) repeat protein